MISRIPFTGDLMILSIHLFIFSYMVSWAQREASRSLSHSPIQPTSLRTCCVAGTEPGCREAVMGEVAPAFTIRGLCSLGSVSDGHRKGLAGFLASGMMMGVQMEKELSIPHSFLMGSGGADVQRELRRGVWEPEMSRLGRGGRQSQTGWRAL